MQHRARTALVILYLAAVLAMALSLPRRPDVVLASKESPREAAALRADPDTRKP